MKKATARLVVFRKQGPGRCSAHKSIRLGISKTTFLNIVEFEFRASNYSGLHEFHVRRTMEEEVWMLSGTKWTRKRHHPKGTQDHPTLPAVCLRPPTLYSFDAPGITGGFPGYTGELNLAGEKDRPLRTDPSVRRVVIKWNFVERVACRVKGPGFETAWEWASPPVPWHAVVDVSRSGPKAKWQRATANSLGRGPVRLGKPS